MLSPDHLLVRHVQFTQPFERLAGAEDQQRGVTRDNPLLSEGLDLISATPIDCIVSIGGGGCGASALRASLPYTRRAGHA
jgi:hypothetical protein